MSSLWDRRTRMLSLLIFLLVTYILNGMWYISQFSPEMVKRPQANWESYFRDAYNVSLLNSSDFQTLVNLTNFKFLINNHRCDNLSDLFIVIFVHSAPENFNKRRAIRETWGNEGDLETGQTVRLVFLLGTVDASELQQRLEDENRVYRDLVQGNFADTYRNLTYKHVMGLKWVTYHCRQARFVLKTDDDIFVDILQLAGYLEGYRGTSASTSRDLMMCFLIRNPYVKRVDSKWSVSFQEYPHKYYPPYCSGWGIIMSPDVVFNLYLQSSKVPYFWVDDVHVSGVLAKKIGVTHVDFTPRLEITDRDIETWLNDSRMVRPCLFGHPDSEIETIYKLWNKTVRFYQWKKEFRNSPNH